MAVYSWASKDEFLLFGVGSTGKGVATPSGDTWLLEGTADCWLIEGTADCWLTE